MILYVDGNQFGRDRVRIRIPIYIQVIINYILLESCLILSFACIRLLLNCDEILFIVRLY